MNRRQNSLYLKARRKYTKVYAACGLKCGMQTNSLPLLINSPYPPHLPITYFALWQIEISSLWENVISFLFSRDCELIWQDCTKYACHRKAQQLSNVSALSCNGHYLIFQEKWKLILVPKVDETSGAPATLLSSSFGHESKTLIVTCFVTTEKFLLLKNWFSFSDIMEDLPNRHKLLQ